MNTKNMTNSELCIYLAKCYTAGSSDANELNKISDWDVSPINFENSDIPWFKVGHNASHDFYLGTDGEGKLFKCSYEVDCEFTIPYQEWKEMIDGGKLEEANQYEKWVEKIHVTPVTNGIGYIGHY